MRLVSPRFALWLGALLALLGVWALAYSLVAGEPVIWSLTVQAVFLILAGAIACAVGWSIRKRIGRRTILVIDFERPVIEALPHDRAARAMLSGRVLVSDVVHALDRAAGDPRVLGLIGRIGDGGQGMAVIEEFRQAVMRFRAAGKPAIAYSETMGEAGPGNGGYYLACAFEEIYLQESGDIGLTGLRAEHPFAAGALEKLDLEMRLDRRREYKSAMDLFTETGFTESHREATESIARALFERIVAGIGEARRLDPERVRELVDRGPFLGREAVDAGLVDGLAYRDQVHARMEERTGGPIKTLTGAAYLALAGSPHRKGVPIALIQAAGAVQRGAGKFSPLSGGPALGADPVCRALREATTNRKIRAIVLRVDSPGGSYVASDTIRREILKAREAGKPVIVTLGNVAASGGYFIAMAGDRVLAQPGSLTGSIGVVGGKALTRKAWKRLGITWDAVETSANSAMFSTLEDYSEQGRARQQAWLDRIYEDFVAKAAADRGMDTEQMEIQARGRVWTGEQALERGLVDELGGYFEAYAAAREQLRLPPDQPLRVLPFPPPKPAWMALLQRDEPGVVAVARGLVEELQPLAAAMRQAGLLGRRGVLELPSPPDYR